MTNIKEMYLRQNDRLQTEVHRLNRQVGDLQASLVKVSERNQQLRVALERQQKLSRWYAGVSVVLAFAIASLAVLR